MVVTCAFLTCSRAAKEERERFALMEEKMHKKRVERLRRREKRNKLLAS
jgi:rRNA-processing protein CGR1